VREFVVYSRHGCHLCDEMLGRLRQLCGADDQLIVRDVDSRAEWADAYGIYVPVLMLDGREICRYELDKQAVAALFDA
jgi:hypothetical protein